MVTIPTAVGAGFGQRVSNARLAPQQIRGATADAFGAAQGRALQDVGQGIASATNTFSQIRDEEDAKELQNLDTELMTGITNNEFGINGEGGYLSKKGQFAVDEYKPFLDNNKKIAEEIAGKATNPRIREQFNLLSQKRLFTSNSGATRYYKKEKLTADIAEKDTNAKANARMFRLNYNNPEISAQSRSQFKQMQTEIGELNGLSGVALTGFVNDKVYNELITPMVYDTTMSDPAKASILIERPDIKKALSENGDYDKTKDAIFTRINNIGKRNQQIRQLSTINSGNEMVNKAYNNELTGEQINSILSDPNQSQSVKDAISSVSGFSKKTKSLSVEEKTKSVIDLNTKVAQFLGKKEKEIKDTDMLNKLIDTELNRGAITQNQAIDYKNDIIEPTVNRMIESLNKWKPWWDNGLGYNKVEKFIKENTQEINADETASIKREKEIQNNLIKDRILRNYTASLKEFGKEKGMKLGDLDGLPDSEIDPLLTSAYEKMKIDYANSFGEGNFDNVSQAENFISMKTQKMVRVNNANTISKAYSKPVNKEVDDFLGEFGL